MPIRLIQLIFFLLPASGVFGQSSPYRHFTTDDGLIHNRCGNIAQDSMGFIWITTDNGICNYDGRKFTFFPGSRRQYYFAHNNNITIYKGACIIGTNEQGVARALGNRLDFIYPENKIPGFVMGVNQLNDSSYLAGNIRDGRLQIITKNTVRYIALPDELQSAGLMSYLVLQDLYHNIWIVTNKGFVIYENGDFNKPFLLPSFLHKTINCMKQDANHNLFISADSAMYYVDAAQLKNIRRVKPIPFAKYNAEITAIGIFSNGDIAFGKYSGSLKIHNKELKLVSAIDKTQSPEEVVWDILMDREENIWLATDNGVYRYGNLSIKNYVLNSARAAPQAKYGAGAGNSFLAASPFDMYSLTQGKLSRLATADNHFLPTEFNIINEKMWVNDFNPYDASYTKSTKEYDFKNHTLSLRNVVLSAQASAQLPDLLSIIKLADGSNYMLTKKGDLISNVNGKLFPVNMPAVMKEVSFSCIAGVPETNSAVLFSNKRGLYHIAFNGRAGTSAVKVLQELPFSETAPAECVQAVLDNNASIWLATENNGLYYFTETGNAYRLQKHFTEPEISSLLLTCIIKDSAGNIWLGSNKGIDKITISASAGYTVYKGLYKNNTLGNYIYFLKEYRGLLHIGSSGGLTTVPLNSTLKTVPPPVYISRIDCNGNNVLPESNSEMTRFGPNENNFSFEFTSPGFINEAQTEYRYKMDGADADWSTPGSNYTVSYNQLAPGKYTFRVKAKNANGLWSASDATFSFSIQKPFYRHLLFYLLCVVAVAGFIYWLYKQKINKIKAVEKTRSMISKDLHDDIGTTMSNLTLMNAVLQNKIDSRPGEAKELAKKMEVMSRGMLQTMSDIVWSANPENDSLEQLIDRLRLFCSHVFEDLGIEYEIRLSSQDNVQKLSMDCRKDIYLICKEIMSNCAKYSRAKNFRLLMNATKNNLAIEATDDGVGFNTEEIIKGNGLKNIRARTAALKGTAHLQTDAGTSWIINLPV